MKYYNIQTVSQMSGLSTHCIRAWEKRYGAIRPERADNGRRVYSEEEVERLLKLAKLSMMGNTISLIANLPDAELDKLLLRMGNKELAPRENVRSLISPEQYLNNMFMALNAYKLDILTHELSKASMDLSCREFALDVLANLLRKVGEYVHAGKMSIAQEHTLSALIKFFVGKRIAQHYKMDNSGKTKILLATPPGEQHSLGLMLGSLLMAENNVSFVYLGEDLPVESIAEAASAINADVVLLAISPAYGRIKNINEICLNLRHSLKGKTEIWLGGAVDQLNFSTLKEAEVTPFDSLPSLEKKILQMVGRQ